MRKKQFVRKMEFIIFYIFYASLFLFYSGEGAKILGIFTLPAKSHFNCNNAVMKTLIDTGHEVTVITSFPELASAENYSSIIDVSMTKIRKLTLEDVITQNVFKSFYVSVDVELPYCIQILKLPEIQRILNSNEKLYDVVFVEMMVFYKCFLHVAEKMQVPVIGIVTMRTFLLADHAIHNPNHPAYIPFELPIPTQKLNLDHIFGRIFHLWNRIVATWHENFVLPKLISQFHQDNADQLGSLGKYMDMEPNLIFYNNHPVLLPRPMIPNAIDIGGIHTTVAKPLPKNIQKFIDEANNGVILFSLGSMFRVSTMLPAHVKKTFGEVFAQIPQRVIWKFEGKMENFSSNVMTLDWLPQRDILEHKNVIAFISHCGLGGTNEAVHTATPVVACPLFGDQLANAELLEGLGVAVRLDIYDVTKENVLYVLSTIINDTRYRDNMQNLSKEFNDRPMTPQQSIVYWTEYVIRHNGARHLKSPASCLSWFKFFMLDVALIVTLIIIITTLFIIRVVKFICSQFLKYFKQRSSKPKNKKI